MPPSERCNRRIPRFGISELKDRTASAGKADELARHDLLEALRDEIKAHKIALESLKRGANIRSGRSANVRNAT